MSDKMVKIAKEAIKFKGNISNLECTHICKDCIFSRRKNKDITCCTDTPENYLKIAEEYLESVENENIPNVINENVNMDDLEIDFDTDELLESALSIEPIINNNEKVERKMSLKEKILAKIDYKKIAEEVFDIIEDEVVEEVVYDFDETNLACDLVNEYRRDFIETAKEVIVENIGQEVDVDEVTEMLKEVAIDKADEI